MTIIQDPHTVAPDPAYVPPKPAAPAVEEAVLALFVLIILSISLTY